jgi:uncharacterized membrane protein YdbT with pleckstrin-like domain
MADLIVRPSVKAILPAYGIGTIVLIAGILLPVLGVAPHFWFVAIIPGIVYTTATSFRHVALLMNKLTISADRLHQETGFLAKQTHTIDLAKVQDVKVDQSVKQRLMNIGAITVETAGGGSRISIDNVDSPQKIADEILSRSKHVPPHL